jgi:hypothetical protein
VNWLGTPEQCRVELSLIKGDAVEGTRVIESPSGDCRSLVPALLTVAALLVESGQTEPAPVPAPAPPRTATTPPSAPRTSPQSGAAPTSRNAGSSFFVGLGGATSSGLAPRLELGPQASIVWAPISPLRLGAEGALFFEHQYGAAPGFSLGHERAALILCGMPLGGYLALGLCATAAVHRFSSQGISLPRAERQTLATATVGASARAEWRLAKNLWWTGSFGADLSTRRLDFYYTTAAGSTIDVFRQERVSPTLMLALTLELL